MTRLFRLTIAITVATLAAWYSWAMPFASDAVSMTLRSGIAAWIASGIIWALLFVLTLRIIALIELD